MAARLPAPLRGSVFTQRANTRLRLLLTLSGHSGRSQRCPLSGVKRTLRRHASMSAYDAVDGATLRHQSAKGWLREANHVEGSRPWARLARLGLILRSQCFRCMGSMTLA